MEGTTDSIDLSEETFSVVQAMMAFLYRAKIKDRVELNRLKELTFWVDLYTLVDRTMIKDLVTDSAQGFYRQAMKCWTSDAFFSVCREFYSRELAQTIALRERFVASWSRICNF